MRIVDRQLVQPFRLVGMAAARSERPLVGHIPGYLKQVRLGRFDHLCTLVFQQA
jgi:hypothetical protein